MKSCILVEDSSTTKEDIEISFEEYYQGGFRTVKGLADELKEYGTVDLHILSEDMGLVSGKETVKNHIENRPEAPDKIIENTINTLKECAKEADVMVILLSSSNFEKIVVEHWEEITKNKKEGSIWCLSAARSSLDSLNLDLIQNSNHDLVTYQRVGVARISNESVDNLIEKVENRDA